MIRPKIKVTEKNKGEWDKFRKRMKSVKGSYVSIGIFEGAGEYEDGTSVIQVGFWNEFGTENIPSRPFIRSALDGKVGLINKWREDLVHQIMEGKITPEKALESLGFRIRELIKNNINSNMPPPNAASTAAHKQAQGIAPRTLVETTLLLRSIEYKVVMAA